MAKPFLQYDRMFPEMAIRSSAAIGPLGSVEVAASPPLRLPVALCGSATPPSECALFHDTTLHRTSSPLRSMAVKT